MLQTDLFLPSKWVKFMENGGPITTDGHENVLLVQLQMGTAFLGNNLKYVPTALSMLKTFDSKILILY